MRHTQAPPTPVVAGRCSLSGTLDIVGERWTLLLLREALMGATRFSEFRVAFPMASNLLTTRLSKLVEAGLMERVPYQDQGQRARTSYHLTPSGTELAIAIGALQQWGDPSYRGGDRLSRAVRPVTLTAEEAHQGIGVFSHFV